MYEQHFGLQRPPFTAKAAGADVFVGPQTALTMAGLKKALQSQDAVIAVWGPAGAGKSTLVDKALDAVAGTHRSVRIGRMSLDGADALEFLLEELGVTELPRGTIRQFAALREKLAQLHSEGKRLVIVVEDAVMTGIDTMAEFEALTAGDTGASGGAAIVVMGDERLGPLLEDRQLARLAQRIRLRQEISPLSAAELRGYLAHCFRKAGKEFEEIFEPDAAVVIHDLSNGNPRIANNLVDAALAAAAASGLAPVSSKFIADVGSNQLGLVASSNGAAIAAPAAVLAPEPVSEQTDRSAGETESPGEPEAESALPREPDPVEPPDPVIVFADEPRDELPDDGDIPELIQDTLPDLEILAPEIVEQEFQSEPPAGNAQDSQPDPLPAAELDAVPESVPESAAAPESVAEDVPEWERDPTLTELKPDLEALEKAMALAHGDDVEVDPPVLEPLAEAAPQPAEAQAEEIPEITLDNAIQERIEDSLVEKPGPLGAGAEDSPEIHAPSGDAGKADQEIEWIAAELAKAKTIEDVDDKLAETLFGEEFSLVAAKVAAMGAADASANDREASLFDTGAATLAQASGSTAAEGAPVEEPAIEVVPETSGDRGDKVQNASASQRMRTVQALNASRDASPPGPGIGEASAPHGPVGSDATPEPIEDQINTSMTQTLKALNVPPPLSDHGDDDADEDGEDESKGGFFSRFRRS